ncbi:hypothetical protein ABZX12_26150 [Kribbella sp. NPDC003505]|uniref:hypothetical protein n=1 Tax=Kribbella sp. NPDC003505 TaxID=3154448 RepID=UPI00339F0B3B
MDKNVRQLDPKGPGHVLISQVIRSVVRRLELPTAWNEQAYETDAPGLRDRIARAWSGQPKPLFDWPTVELNEDNSLTVRSDLLRSVLADLRRANRIQNGWARQAVLRITHAAVELSQHAPVTDLPASHHEDDASGALRLGLAQDQAFKLNIQVLQDTGVRSRAPHIESSRLYDQLPDLTSASRRFVTDLAAAARISHDGLPRRLLATDPSQLWNHIGKWMIDGNLNRGMAPDQRERLRAELAGIAHDGFSEIAGIADKLADMPSTTAVQRVHKVDALRTNGAAAAASTVQALTARIERVPAALRQKGPQLDHDASGAIPLGRLRGFLEQVRTTPSTGGAPARVNPATNRNQP